MKPSHYIAAIILLLISLIFCDGFHITKRLDDEPDPIWFSDIDLNKGQGLAFAFESDDSYASSSTSVESPERELSWKDLSDEEKSLWNRLLNREDKLINTYMILNKLLHLRKGQNFRYEGVRSGDIETLIKLKPIRMSGCSPIRLKERRSLFEGSVLATKPKLAEYLNLTYNRQLRLCVFFLDRLASHGIRNLTNGTHTYVSAMVNALRAYFNQTRLEYGIPRSGWTIRVISDFLMNSAITSRVLWPIINNTNVRTGEFHRAVMNHLEPHCDAVEDGIGEIIDFLDLLYPPENPDRMKFKIANHTRYWISAARLCRLLTLDQRVTDLIYMDIRTRSPRSMNPSAIKRLIATIPESWLTPMMNPWTDLIRDRDPSLIYEINDMMVRESNIFRKLSFDRSIEIEIDNTHIYDIQEEDELDPVELVQWNLFRIDFDTNLFTSAIVPLGILSRRYKDKYIAFRDITSDDIHELLTLRESNITNCSKKMMIYRWEKYRDPRLRSMSTLRRYIDIYTSRQVALCWSILNLIILENVYELHTKTRVKMNEIRIHEIVKQGVDHLEKSVDHDSVYEALAEFILRQPIYKYRYQMTVSNHRGFTPMDLVDVLGDIFDGHCRFVGDALNDIINYLDSFRDFWDQVDLNFNSKLWIAYGRICRSFSQIHRVYIKLKALQEDIDKGQLISSLNDGLTFTIGPETSLMPRISLGAETKVVGRLPNKFSVLINSDPIDRYELTQFMRSFLNMYPGENIKLGPISTYHIEALIRIQPLRLANCLVDNMRERKTLMEEFKVEVPKLKDYFDYYNHRQMQICWNIFEDLIENRSMEVPNYIQNHFRKIHFLILSRTIDLLPENPIISINSIKILTNGLITHNVVKDFLFTMREPKIYSSKELYQILSDTIGERCVRLNLEVGDLLDYYDEFYSIHSNRKYLDANLNEGTRLILSYIRFCRLLFSDETFFKQIYHEFIKQGKLVKPPGELGYVELDTTSYWYNWSSKKGQPLKSETSEASSSRWADIVSDEEEEEKRKIEIRRLGDSLFREANVTFPSIPGDGYYWNVSGDEEFGVISRLRPESWDIVLSLSSQRYTVDVNLEHLLHPTNLLDGYDQFDRADIRNLINLKPAGLINCSLDMMIELVEFQRNPRFINYTSLKEYRDHNKKFQDILCQRFNQHILVANLIDIPELKRNIIYRFRDEIKTNCPREFKGFKIPNGLSCLHYSIAKIVFSLYRIPNRYSINVETVDTAIKNVFSESYEALELAIGDYLDFLESLDLHEIDTKSLRSNATDDLVILTSILRGLAKDREFRRYVHAIFYRLARVRIEDAVDIPDDWFRNIHLRLGG